MPHSAASPLHATSDNAQFPDLVLTRPLLHEQRTVRRRASPLKIVRVATKILEHMYRAGNILFTADLAARCCMSMSMNAASC